MATSLTLPHVRFFADSEKTAVRSAAKFAIAIQLTFRHIFKKKLWPDDPKGHVTMLHYVTESYIFSKFDIVPKENQLSEILNFALYSKGIGVYQHNALWAMNERAQERCRRVTCTCHVG